MPASRVPAVLVLSTALAAALATTLCLPAAAAAPACPTSFQPVTAEQVDAQLTPEQRDAAAAEGGVAGLFAARDANRNGVLCQQTGSVGRAPGQPSYYGNYKDDRVRA